MESDGQLASDAHLCYIVSGNTEQLVASWDKVLADSASSNTLQVMLTRGSAFSSVTTSAASIPFAEVHFDGPRLTWINLKKICRLNKS